MDPLLFSSELKPFEKYFSNLLKSEAPPPSQDLQRFWETMEYSLFGGGKRFRPLLSLLTAKALGKDQSLVFPLAAAIEMIHTYSLIHDDLPCLDNDDERRGRPTSHKVFGEDMALLAGDGLQSLCFYVLATGYSNHPRLGKIIEQVAFAAGPQGMVGGQVLDMLAGSQSAVNEKGLEQIHRLKTGALIRASVAVAGEVCMTTSDQQARLTEFGEVLGLAFQVADDIEDHSEGEDSKNFVLLLGLDKTKLWLSELSKKALSLVESFDSDHIDLKSLVEFNRDRV